MSDNETLNEQTLKNINRWIVSDHLTLIKDIIPKLDEIVANQKKILKVLGLEQEIRDFEEQE